MLFLALVALAIPSYASSSVQLDCTSYSKTYDFHIVVSQSSADVTVLRSSDRGPMALPQGKTIHLDPQEETSPAWIGFLGTSSRRQEVTFRAQRSELSRGGAVTAHLNISPEDDDTYSVDNELNCSVAR